MWTRLKKPELEVQANQQNTLFNSLNLDNKSKRNNKNKDSEWVDKLGYTPLVSKSMVALPRFGTTKQQLIEQLLQIPYKGVAFQKQSTCQDKSFSKYKQDEQQMPSFWLLNDFLQTTDFRRNKNKQKQMENMKTNSESKNSKYKIEKNKQRSFNKSAYNDQKQQWVIDYFLKQDERSVSSDVISQSSKKQFSKKPFIPSQTIKFSQLVRANKTSKDYSPASSYYHPKYQTSKSSKLNQFMGLNSIKTKPQYVSQAVQTSMFDNTSKQIQCSIIKQKDGQNQYSFSLPNSQQLSISQIQKQSQQYSDKQIQQSIKYIESSIQQRKPRQSISSNLNIKTNKPILNKDKSSNKEDNETIKKQNKRQEQKQKSQPKIENKNILEQSKKKVQQKKETMNQNKIIFDKKKEPISNQTQKGSNTNNKSNSSSQQQQSFKDYQSSEQHQNQSNKPTVTKNMDKTDKNNDNQFQKDQKHQGIKIGNKKQANTNINQSKYNTNNSKKSNEHSQLEQSIQNQPIRKSVDLLEEKKKRDKLLKLQQQTNKKLSSIFDTKPIKNNSQKQENSGPNSKISQIDSIVSKQSKKQQNNINQLNEVINQKEQKPVKQIKQSKEVKQNSYEKNSELSLSDMKSFNSKDVSKRIYQDFVNYNESGSNLFDEEGQEDDFDSFENYQSSNSDNSDKRRHMLSEVKQQDENQQSIAQSKVNKNFIKKQSKKKTKQLQLNNPLIIQQQKSQPQSVEQSIVQQYSYNSTQKNKSQNSINQNQQTKPKIPKMQNSSKKSQSFNNNDDSFDLQQFIVKDIKNNVDQLKNKMSKQVSQSSSNGSISNVFDNFNKQIKYQDFKTDIDQLKNKIVTSNNL